MPDPIPMYGYSRVSKVGARGDDLISPELQQHAIDQWAAANNVVIIEHICDLDESGRKFEKRAVARMLKGIADGESRGVVLWKWSRWGRNLLQSKLYIAETEAAGGTVRAATEDFDPETTMGKFTRDQMLLIAELQSNQISDSWKETQAKRRRDGLPHNGGPRFGYRYDKREGYSVDPDVAPLLRECYERYLAGVPMGVLARELTGRGIFTPRTGIAWDPASLGRVLDTGFAAGLIRERSKPKVGDDWINSNVITSFDVWREGAHEPIIDLETWERYKARRAVMASRRGRSTGVQHTFSNLLTCSVCDSNMIAQHSGSSSGRRISWACGENLRRRQRGLDRHEPVFLSDAKVEKAFLGWLADQATPTPDDFGEQVQAAAGQVPKVQTQVHALEAREAALVAKRSRLARLLLEEMVDPEDARAMRREIDAELATIQESLTQERAVAAKATARPDPEAFRGLLEEWEHLSPVERREAILEPMVRTIKIAPGRQVAGKVEVIPTWA